MTERKGVIERRREMDGVLVDEAGQLPSTRKEAGKMKKRTFGILVAMVMLSMFGFAASGQAAEIKELKLGLNVPLSGPASDWGQLRHNTPLSF